MSKKLPEVAIQQNSDMAGKDANPGPLGPKARACDLLRMSITLAFSSMRPCLSKRTSLSWSVAAMAGLDGSGVADGL